MQVQQKSIDDLPITVRTANALVSAGWRERSVEELKAAVLRKGRSFPDDIPNMGVKSFLELVDVLGVDPLDIGLLPSRKFRAYAHNVVVLAMAMGGRPLEEIAEAHRCSVQAVKGRLRKMLSMLNARTMENRPLTVALLPLLTARGKQRLLKAALATRAAEEAVRS